METDAMLDAIISVIETSTAGISLIVKHTTIKTNNRNKQLHRIVEIL